MNDLQTCKACPHVHESRVLTEFRHASYWKCTTWAMHRFGLWRWKEEEWRRQRLTNGEHNSPKSAPHPSTYQAEQRSARHNGGGAGGIVSRQPLGGRPANRDCKCAIRIADASKKRNPLRHRAAESVLRFPLDSTAARQNRRTSLVFCADFPSWSSPSFGRRSIT